MSRPSKRILLIHLGALGAVVRSTALLPAIHAKYPRAHITWVTDGPGDLLLKGHPLVDRIIKADSDGLAEISALAFDVAFVVDKSLKAAGVLKATKADMVFGFIVDPKTGAINPATPAANELWEIGLSNRIKFFENRKSENRLIHEALELGTFRRDRYSLHLEEAERGEVSKRHHLWSLAGKSAVIGVNTGCASTIAAKKLSVDGHVRLLQEIDRLYRLENESEANASIVLLGGREDSARNAEIAKLASAHGLLVTESATALGLRDGMISVAACDVVLSGDSLGMHMALAFHKPVVAWFGPTCAHEVDLYGGVAVITSAHCSPCWKRSCDKQSMCYDQVDFSAMAREAVKFAKSREQSRPVGRGETVSATPLEINADL